MTTPDLAGIIERDRGMDLPGPKERRNWSHHASDSFMQAHRDRRALLVLLRETREALRDANQIIAMTRQHLSVEHADCAYTALGIMNDGHRAALAEP